jgi:nucleoside-diphosphate-sugar epimerase
VWIVTGASGFVGGHIVDALRPGVEVKGLLRRDVPAWDLDGLRRAVSGAEGIVHAASVVHSPSTPEAEYVRFNREGTGTLLRAAREAGVRRFVFISSIKVHGEEPAGVIDESTPRVAATPYASTKADAEDLVLAAADLAPIVLRLCPVYGRGDKGHIRTMISAIARRRFVVPGDGSTRKSIVHVSTVADVVRAATEKPATGVFVVADRHAPSIRELADTIARNLGRSRPLSVPEPLLLLAASVIARVARRAGVKTPISRELIAKSLTSTVCDPSRVERELGVRCAVDLEAMLADEIAWFHALPPA